MGGSGDSPYDLRNIGSSGGGGQGGGGAGGDSDDDCARLTFEAVISSPNPSVVATLSVGDVLTVVLGGSGGVPLVELHASDGRLAGTLTSHMPDLLRCLPGTSYIAEVLSITGGATRVRVSAG